MNNFRRTIQGRWIGGVFGGLGRAFNLSPIALRVIFLVLYITTRSMHVSHLMFFAYLLTWALVKNDRGQTGLQELNLR